MCASAKTDKSRTDKWTNFNTGKIDGLHSCRRMNQPEWHECDPFLGWETRVYTDKDDILISNQVKDNASEGSNFVSIFLNKWYLRMMAD